MAARNYDPPPGVDYDLEIQNWYRPTGTLSPLFVQEQDGDVTVLRFKHLPPQVMERFAQLSNREKLYPTTDAIAKDCAMYALYGNVTMPTVVRTRVLDRYRKLPAVYQTNIYYIFCGSRNRQDVVNFRNDIDADVANSGVARANLANAQNQVWNQDLAHANHVRHSREVRPLDADPMVPAPLPGGPGNAAQQQRIQDLQAEVARLNTELASSGARYNTMADRARFFEQEFNRSQTAETQQRNHRRTAETNLGAMTAERDGLRNRIINVITNSPHIPAAHRQHIAGLAGVVVQLGGPAGAMAAAAGGLPAGPVIPPGAAVNIAGMPIPPPGGMPPPPPGGMPPPPPPAGAAGGAAAGGAAGGAAAGGAAGGAAAGGAAAGGAAGAADGG